MPLPFLCRMVCCSILSGGGQKGSFLIGTGLDHLQNALFCADVHHIGRKLVAYPQRILTPQGSILQRVKAPRILTPAASPSAGKTDRYRYSPFVYCRGLPGQT